MYQVEQRAYGVLLTFSDFILKDEMARWVQDSKALLKKLSPGFGVIVDMRALKPLASDARDVMGEGQKAFKEAGMSRSAVVVETSMIAMQFKNIAKQTGIYQWERYISAATHPDWEKLALARIEKGIDPDHS